MQTVSATDLARHTREILEGLDRRCGDCTHDKLVAFSCKRRGFCLSCGARRTSETAANLVHHVIPQVPVLQWIPSLADSTTPISGGAA